MCNNNHKTQHCYAYNTINERKQCIQEKQDVCFICLRTHVGMDSSFNKPLKCKVPNAQCCNGFDYEKYLCPKLRLNV